MKTLDALLTHAAGNNQSSNVARMKNCHLAKQIVGSYARGGTREMAMRLHKSEDTIEDYARAARVFSQLLAFCWYCERAERTRNFRTLSEIMQEYGYPYFEALYVLVIEQEEPRAAFEQLRIVLENATIISSFRGLVNPARKAEWERAVDRLNKSVNVLLQPVNYGMPRALAYKAKIAEAVMNGATHACCPDCNHQIELERWAEQWYNIEAKTH